ncbi:MAG TPA: hypothetical protein VHV82_13215 [Sporichthyaceae bacterium]|jgi:hypothetical protein|nr:hypothetical protein [Sporichthyaceae bacterium]
MTDRHRRTAPVYTSLVCCVVAGALGLAASSAGPVEAAANFVPGTGTSSAGVARIQMRTSGAAIGFGFGVARARFAGAQGNAEADSVDLGLFNTLSKAPLACGYSMDRLFPPGAMPAGVVVSSSDGATEKRTASAGDGGPLQFGSQYGSAAPDASAAATVDGISLDLPGVVNILGGTASSTAKLVPGAQRASAADSALGRMTLAGGVVELEGLHWTADHRTGDRSEATAGFSIGSMTVAGRPLPTADAGQLQAAFAAANTALTPSGLSIGAPEITRTPTGVSIGPLRLSVTSTPALRAALAAALLAIQPVRTQLLSFVAPLQAGPDCGLARALGFAYLAIDLATLALGDQGALDLEMGGAAAGTDGTAYANPFDSGYGLIHPVAPLPAALPGTFPGPPVTRPATPSFADVPAAPPVAVAMVPVPPAPGRPVEITAVAMSCRSVDGGGCTAGHGRLAGWLVLGLIAALAMADRLRSRRT